jgi:F-type H+-transporting ATPase subunit gamma
MSSLRELRERINTVASTAKITGAIKMIASAKFHRYEQKLSQAAPYHEAVKQILTHLYASEGEGSLQSEFMSEREVRHIAIVALGSDGGLCGAYNINICKSLKAATDQLQHDGITIDLYPIGKKFRHVIQSAKLQGVNIIADPDIKAETDAQHINRLLATLQERFVHHEVDKVELMYMHHHSATRQTFLRQSLFPVEFDSDGNDGNNSSNSKANDIDPFCILEPDANKILNNVLPMYAASMMHNAFMENLTCTYAIRIIAMETANDNATKLNDELTLEFNKLRQEEITTQLLDIQGGQTGG